VGLRLPPVDENQKVLNAMTWQLHTYGASEVARPDVVAWIEGPHAFGADAHSRLRSDRLYLVRHDQFVAASIPLRGHNGDAEQLTSAMSAGFWRSSQSLWRIGVSARYADRYISSNFLMRAVTASGRSIDQKWPASTYSTATLAALGMYSREFS
jgi:hypothetical protein